MKEYYGDDEKFPTWEMIDYYLYESVDEKGRFVFRNRFDRHGTKAKKDEIAGGYYKRHNDIRYNLRLCGKLYQEAGKLLWILRNKQCWPKDENGKYLVIDHIDGNTENNFISNLRPVTVQQNAANSKIYSHNKSGYNGVYWHKRDNKWRSKIMYNGKNIHIGCYTDIHEAAEAYNEKAREFFGEYARLNVINREKGE